MVPLSCHRRLLLPVLSLSVILGAACSSEPKPPPGGAAAAAAAGEAADRYASGLRRAIDTGKRDKALSVLRAVGSALEQHVIDVSSYPEAPTCQSLSDALSLRGGQGLPPADPWGTPYDCRSRSGGYVLRSAGEDGQQGTEDDLVVEGGEDW
jgi:hypothetical protein